MSLEYSYIEKKLIHDLYLELDTSPTYEGNLLLIAASKHEGFINTLSHQNDKKNSY